MKALDDLMLNKIKWSPKYEYFGKSW